MKISNITEEAIVFDNGKAITYDHDQDCCEQNYADFKQIDSIAREYEYTEPLMFEAVQDSGFRFGDSHSMFFVPCYSEQNGYYSVDIEIYYDGKKMLHFKCEEKLY
jgi:hypothetical protein